METTTTETLQKLHAQLFVWSQRHDDGLARPHSRTMERRYGQKTWYRMKHQLIVDGVLELVDPSYFRTDLDHRGERRKGRTAGYRVQPPARITVTPNTSRPYTTAEQRYFETHARTNLSSAPFITIKDESVDMRVYTDFTSTPKAERKRLTIDGAPTVSLDISNAFFCGIAEALSKKITHRDTFYELVFSGRLYDEIAALAGVSRDAAKLALNKAANSPYRLRFHDDTRSGVSGASQSQAWATFRNVFPQIARIIRVGAKRKTNWRIGNQWEGRYRKALQNLFYASTGYTPLDVHDEIYVKEQDLPVLLQCMYRVARNVPFKVGGHRYSNIDTLPSHSQSLPLVCNTHETLSGAADVLHKFFTIDPPDICC
jgi:hypothetical protein